MTNSNIGDNTINMMLRRSLNSTGGTTMHNHNVHVAPDKSFQPLIPGAGQGGAGAKSLTNI